MPKEIKTEKEIEALIMEEFRKYHDCAHIAGVKVNRVTRDTWKTFMATTGDKPAGPHAEAIVQKMHDTYCLSPEQLH